MPLSPAHRRAIGDGQLRGLSAVQRRLRAAAAANARWSRESPQMARQRVLDYYTRLVDPDGVLEPRERDRRATAARRAHMAALSFKASKARAARKGGELPDA